MNITYIREELHEYIDQADDRVLNLIYAMIHADMKESDYQITEEHKKILDERLEDHTKNPSAGSSWDDVETRLRKKL